jgi:hypothetical protein
MDAGTAYALRVFVDIITFLAFICVAYISNNTAQRTTQLWLKGLTNGFTLLSIGSLITVLYDLDTLLRIFTLFGDVDPLMYYRVVSVLVLASFILGYAIICAALYPELTKVGRTVLFATPLLVIIPNIAYWIAEPYVLQGAPTLVLVQTGIAYALKALLVGAIAYAFRNKHNMFFYAWGLAFIIQIIAFLGAVAQNIIMIAIASTLYIGVAVLILIGLSQVYEKRIIIKKR